MRSLFENIDMSKLFVKPENAEWAAKLQSVWTGFWSLFKRVNTPDADAVARELEDDWENDMLEWMLSTFQSPTPRLDPESADFQPSVLPASAMTPYVHIFVYHLCQLLLLHGELHSFSMQSQELINLSDGAGYFAKNSRRKTADLQTLLLTIRKRVNPAKICRKHKLCLSCGKQFATQGRLKNHVNMYCTFRKA
jgi:hypothetical protein